MTDSVAEIIDTHLNGPDGCCTGCRNWWALLVPHPCWQLTWALQIAGRTMTMEFLTHGTGDSRRTRAGRSTPLRRGDIEGGRHRSAEHGQHRSTERGQHRSGNRHGSNHRGPDDTVRVLLAVPD